MGKQKIIVIITVLFVIVSGIFYSVSYEKEEEAVFIAEETTVAETEQKSADCISEENDSQENETEKEMQKESEDSDKELIYVHICGQVNSPGVYCLEEERRVMDIVEMAGGFTDSAAKDYVNLAQRLSDGQKVYIPALEEVSGINLSLEGENISQQEKSSGKVNINTADKDTLMTLTGIGEAKATAIIKYREENGSFDSIEELKQIEGIKDGVFNKIKDQIEV